MVATGQTLKTRWAAGITPENAWREYPRPQMVRKDWVNLNGLWHVELRHPDPAREYPVISGTILVPYPAESQLSGFHHSVSPDQLLHYERTFERPKGDRVLLHFEAVDWLTRVYVNGKLVGDHTGGYDRFTFDITDSLTHSGDQKLEVDVCDPTDEGYEPRGKQALKPEGIFYTPTTGIWQTVWLEGVPPTYIGGLKIEPLASMDEVNVSIEAKGNLNGKFGRVEVIDRGKVVAEATAPLVTESIPPERPGQGAQPLRWLLNVPDGIAWSPENPHLYDLRVTLLDADKEHVIDEVTSYFGFRQISLVKNDKGQPVIALNGKPYFLIGTLDQGFWPDGLYTPPSDEAMKYDLEVTKRLGFNMIRKHVKVEPERWYYWCDKLGICVLQDMPSGDKFIGPNDPDIDRSPESAADFRAELKAMVDTHFNHPSIVTWVLYNEGWGQWNTEEMTHWLKSHDPTRLVDATTGWTDRGVGDYSDIHDYPGPGIPKPDPNRALFLGEFGGLGLPEPGHMWKEKGWGYQSFKTSEELTNRFVEIFEGLKKLEGEGLSGAVYTQTTDVETELNGLMTYDRKVIKMDEHRIRQAIEALRQASPRETATAGG
ncbi:MAG TPA: glycoside hydrolase family 2 TIM barrel-domain containing protein [Fimbriimonadaceae bacterium]|nr:glycoside hydrolase family 2 TIM barrel-domain containing protein [Fimbriimonadaceae bacterium]